MTKLLRLKQLIPDMIIGSIPLLIISFGLITNSGIVGRILGTFMGILTDPPSTIIALIVGASIIRYRFMVPLTTLASIVVTYAIMESISDYRRQAGLPVSNTWYSELFIFRIWVFFTLAHFSHFFRAIRKPTKNKSLT